MDVVQVDDEGLLYFSPDIDDWEVVRSLRIAALIDLDGDVDPGVPTAPDHMLYVYMPIYDEELPDLTRLHAVASLGATLIGRGQPVLAHCRMGFNRSALLTGLIMMHLGMSGEEVVAVLRRKRPGALFNQAFAEYLTRLNLYCATGSTLGSSWPSPR
jgi:protein-tyrosine phosphatase